MGKDVEIGRLLRQKRLEYEWSLETVAELYGKAVKGEPISKGTVFNMEEGTIAGGEKRRWVLARMFNIAPVVFGLKALQEDKGTIPSSFSSRRSQSIDISEYRTALHSYKTQGYQGSPESALKDLGQRIYALHDNAYYVRSPQRVQMKRLLVLYHARRSTVAGELSYYRSALEHLNKALILAQEEDFVDLEAYVLYKLGEIFFVRRDFPRALRTLKKAQSKMEDAPKPVRGIILQVRGLTEAYLAQANSELSGAMKWMDASERYITTPSRNDVGNDTLFDHTEVEYLLDRAKSLVAPTDRKIHLSEEAYHLSDEILQKSDPTRKREYAYHVLDSHIVLAQYYLDKGYYPMATTLTEEALSQIEKMHSRVHLPTVVRLYEQLTESSYGKSVEVAELGLHLLFVQYPSLFE